MTFSSTEHHFLLLKIKLITALPIFRSTPARDVGIPVSRAICCFTFVMPSALFREKLSPEIFGFDLVCNKMIFIK